MALLLKDLSLQAANDAYNVGAAIIMMIVSRSLFFFFHLLIHLRYVSLPSPSSQDPDHESLAEWESTGGPRPMFAVSREQQHEGGFLA